MNRITVTPAAAEYFKKYTQSMDAVGVRLGLKSTGCAGYSYVWDLVYQYQAQDETVCQQHDGFTLLVDAHSADLLAGSQIDLEADQTYNQVIKVTSAKQSATCGCGESVTFHV